MSFTDALLEDLKRSLFASASAINQTNVSISPAFSDYYLDSNYGLGGAGGSPSTVKIVFLASEQFDEELKSSYDYVGIVANMFSEPTAKTVFKPTFDSIHGLGQFVQAAAYTALSENVYSEKFIGQFDIKVPDENREAMKEIYTIKEDKVDAFANTAYFRHVLAALIKMSAGSDILSENEGTRDEKEKLAANVVTIGLRPWRAYQYIDYVPIGGGSEKYDSFLETQVRQLTKVVFVANLLRAAHSRAVTPVAKAAIGNAFNQVIRLPEMDSTMLKDFLDKDNVKNLDNMFKANVEKSAELYDAASDLENKDAKMRQAQDNLRAINTNDELMTNVRRRAFILYVVVWVMMIALVGALSIAFATGNSGVMYATVAVVCVLVLLTEVTRGIGKLLRI